MTATLTAAVIAETRASLDALARVRRDLAVCRLVHRRLTGTARERNVGRIARLEREERLAMVAVAERECDLSAL